MEYTPGSKSFYEAIEIPGVEMKMVDASLGKVHVVLIIDTKTDAQKARQMYLDRCSKIPITQLLAVSVAKLCVRG